MIVSWIVSLFASLSILALWAVARWAQRSWISPGGMICAVWFFGTLLPLCFAAYFPVHASAYLLILLFVLAGVVGSSLPMLVAKPAPERDDYSFQQKTLLYRVYAVCLAVGSLTPLVLYRTLATEFGTFDLLELAAKVTVARYAGDFAQPLAISLLTMVLFFASLLGGLLAGLSEKGRGEKARCLAWLLPLMICSMMQTTKASVMFGGGLFGAGLVTGIVLRGQENRVRFVSLIAAISFVCIIGFLFIFAGLLVRYRTFDSDQAENSIPTATIYFVGHMGALGEWMEGGGIKRASLRGGSYTFGGLFELAGLHNRDQGLFEEMVEFQNVGTTNIYTAFRCCIEDFSLPGGLLFFFCFSILGGAGWARVLQGDKNGAVPLLLFLAYTFLSPITSVFVYNTNVGAFVLMGALLTGVSCLHKLTLPTLARREHESV